MEEGAHGRHDLGQAILPPFLPGRMVSSQASGLSFFQAHQLHGQGEGWQGQALHDGPVFCTEKRRAHRLLGGGLCTGSPRFPTHSSFLPDLPAGR